ncbi:hypothetical protein NEOKW01_0609 [Nematocida sp. AWRm80]|nr:hypothetical protein NEOKW01_0609 [Nematocida sp. AWRm80]
MEKECIEYKESGKCQWGKECKQAHIRELEKYVSLCILCKKEAIYKTNCSHTYCSKCLLDSLKESTRCPQCHKDTYGIGYYI